MISIDTFQAQLQHKGEYRAGEAPSQPTVEKQVGHPTTASEASPPSTTMSSREISSLSSLPEDWKEKFYNAITNGDLDTVKSLLKNGADIEYHIGPEYLPFSPLFFACNTNIPNSFEITKFLVESSANVNGNETDIGTPLWRASAKGNWQKGGVSTRPWCRPSCLS